MRDQAIHSVVASLPPVLGRTVIQEQRGSLFERKLPGSATHVVKFGDGLDLLNLWKRISKPGQLIYIWNKTIISVSMIKMKFSSLQGISTGNRGTETQL